MLLLEHRAIAPGEGHQAGRILLREMVEAHTGLPMPDIVLTERGKPCFPGSGLHFSISHTKHHVFCALSDRPVGIDAEETNREIPLKLSEKILSGTELARYHSARDPRLALLTFWVLKEARAKFLGTGLTGYPNHTDFSLDDPRVTQIHGCLLAVIQEEHYAV